eukprot:CAMPEP_0198291244 /NCGR_PEP_ID=MMETSP1449-20131203/8836_1 /TAXON_ID=420275 /ORGANISM="Attheya septentrionalis, Strain CCMP2084" /LENGTH=221 /DNA_ID=CAMNT_0043989859 /DNA_START=127 /DNA_END=792 /DNA_ORIENTATION=+
MMHGESASSTDAAGLSSSSSSSPDGKVEADLVTLTEQIELCRSMMKSSSGSNVGEGDEALLGVIGFLEACAPRMLELVQAGTQGALSETILEQCLTANDLLLHVLSDLDNPFSSPPSAASAASKKPDDPTTTAASTTDMLNDLLLDDNTPQTTTTTTTTSKSQPPQPPSAFKTTGEVVEDPFATNVLTPTPLDDGTKPAAASGTSEFDDFDAFLNERSSAD